ncbi:glutathione peroxidase [Guggenheimella bovis]
MKNIYEAKVTRMNGQEITLEHYKDSVLLIVNTATGCGFTPQYEGLQKLHEKYNEKGLKILDFPCNQFLEQAPGENEEVHNFCIQNFGISYDQFQKIDVNGENADPLYVFLKEQKPVDKTNEKSEGFLAKLKEIGQERTGSDIRWNFTKFLVDREGNVVERFSPTIEPEELEKEIEKYL